MPSQRERRFAGTLALSWGPWGGFYANLGFCPRICLGWLAITYCRVDLDDMMEAYAREADTITITLSTNEYDMGKMADFFNDVGEIDGSDYTRVGA